MPNPRHNPNGGGSIYKLPNGRYAAAVTIPGTDGRRKVRKARTSEEAQRLLTQMLHDIHHAVPIHVGRQTVGQYMRHWLENSARDSVKQTTWRSHEIAVRLHIIPGLGKTAMEALTWQHVQSMTRGMLNKGLQPGTVNRVRKVLRKALQEAVRGGLIQRNPVDLTDPIRARVGEVRALTQAEVDEFLCASEGDRLHPLYLLAVSLGLRKGEILALRWPDIDLDKGMLWVRATMIPTRGGVEIVEPKTQKSRRRITLPRFLVDAFGAHRRRQHEERLRAGPHWQDYDLVFPTTVGTPFHPRNLSRSFDALLVRAGIRHFRFHDLRHSAASLMIADGVPVKLVSEILGHANISITLEIYGHLYEEQRKEAADKMDLRFGRAG